MEDLNALSLPDLFHSFTKGGSLHRILVAARDEDLGRAGDITTRSIIAPDQRAEAVVAAREPGVVAGGETMTALADEFGIQWDCRWMIPDGDACSAGDVIAELHGCLADLLAVERTLLNLVGRMCGIATLTRRYVDAVRGTEAKICETRKTTPGLRALEKYAVRCGGGFLHRLGLYDAALYKDNHLAHLGRSELAAALREAITKVRAAHEVRFVEVEVDTLQQLEEVLSLRKLVDIILLDNMTPDVLRQAVAMRDRVAPGIELEASGGIMLEGVAAIAASGVDRISIGGLTHAARSLDIALDVC